jgi:hypothetical protein
VAEIGLKDRKCHRRLKEQNDIGENPHRNGRFFVGLEICGLVGLNGGVPSPMRTGLSLQFLEMQGDFAEMQGQRRLIPPKSPHISTD